MASRFGDYLYWACTGGAAILLYLGFVAILEALVFPDSDRLVRGAVCTVTAPIVWLVGHLGRNTLTRK